MTQIVRWLREGLITFVLCVLLIAGIVLFAALVRPLLIVTFVAMLGVAVLSIFSPRLREWIESPSRY